MLTSTIIGILFGASIGVALLLVWIKTNRHSAVIGRTLMNEAEDSISFLFDNEALVDLTPRARALMDNGNQDRSDWENFLTLLSARFPHLRSQCHDLAAIGYKTIAPQDRLPGWIEAEYWNGLARITLVQDKDHPDETLDALTAGALEHELKTLRGIGEDSPQLIWKKDAEGVLIWANRAYFELTEALYPQGPDDILMWPPKIIFADTAAPVGSAPVIDLHRIDIAGTDKPVWFEVTGVKRGTDTIYFAVDASAVVFAQDAQRTFVQTLTKTFAQLSVGLAIFDKSRNLVMFNPAVIDLTSLPADFLIGRPSLFSMLDRLRDLKMIPEPKDYASWRDQMVELEAAASKGSYHETWSLPNGQTYRVTGKPHPNGAIAFIFEDISDEMSLTRKFRAQIDTGSAVLDNLPTAICVFSSSGALIISNAAYRNLWGSAPDDGLASRDFHEELAAWKLASAPSPIWIKLDEVVKGRHFDGPWEGVIRLSSHVELNCNYAALPNGSHQIMFTPVEIQLDQTSRSRKIGYKAS